MADQKISQLTTIVTVDNATDLFPIVDTSVGETKKITPTALKTALALNNVDNTTDALKPVSTATQTALNGKQDTLVSATNIKTVNSTSLLGSGDIVVGATPSGVAGAIQFSDGTAFASDAANLFFDNTNNRLGVGTNSPTSTVQIKGKGATSATTSLLVQDSAGTQLLKVDDAGALILSNSLSAVNNITTSTGDIQASGVSAQIKFGSRIVLQGMADGVLRITNNAATDFNRLQLGGTTSSFPAIKRALNNIEVKNADDTYGAGFSVGAALNTSAILQADSTTKGFLPPRMTTTQKNAISSPPAGLMVYDTTLNKLCVRTASAWETITSS